MTPAAAVELWNDLEQMLIRIGLPQDGRLDRLRAELIRKICGDEKVAVVKTPLRKIELDDSAPRTIATIHRDMVVASANTIYDARWAAMIERACSGASGYEGNDSVSYESSER